MKLANISKINAIILCDFYSYISSDKFMFYIQLHTLKNLCKLHWNSRWFFFSYKKQAFRPTYFSYKVWSNGQFFQTVCEYLEFHTRKTIWICKVWQEFNIFLLHNSSFVNRHKKVPFFPFSPLTKIIDGVTHWRKSVVF